MNSPHSDPLTSAQHLIRRAIVNGKPIRVFIGFHGIGGRRYALASATSKSGITASMPNTVIEVSPTDDPEKVAEILMDQWAVVDRQRQENSKPSTSVPVNQHLWRTSREFGRKDRRSAGRERSPA